MYYLYHLLFDSCLTQILLFDSCLSVISAGPPKMTRQERMSNYFMLRDQTILEMGRYGESVKYVEEWEKEGSLVRVRTYKKWGGAVQSLYGIIGRYD